MECSNDRYNERIQKIQKSMVIERFDHIDFPVLTIDATYNDNRTEKLLDILEEYGAKATFFLSGIWTEKYYSHLERMDNIGCEIGNHSYDHPFFYMLSSKEIEEQINKTQQINTVNSRMAKKFFRFPYGAFTTKELALVKHMGYEIFQWSIESLDWKYSNPDKVFDKICNASPGDILLLHNDGEGTAEALGRLLHIWQKNGTPYQFSTISAGMQAENGMS